MLLVILLFVSACHKSDVTPTSSAIIWQGFHHVWEYNHRVNRMGDWLTDIGYSNGYSANAYHSAASGIGPDKCEYISFLTGVQTYQDIYFKSIGQEIILSGEEETIDSQLITLQLDFPLVNDPQAIVLLNGFDMYARPAGSEGLIGDGDADKLFNFSILPQSPLVINTADQTTVSFDVLVTLGGACASPECSSGASYDFFDYLVTTNFQVILASNSLIHSVSKTLENAYEWQRPINNTSHVGEIYPADFIIRNSEIQGEAGFDNAFLGIKGFQFQTEKGFGGFNGQSFEYPHMQTFNLAVQPIQYDSNSGQLTFDTDLFFKNWAAPVPFFSFGAGGKAAFNLEVLAIQIADEKAAVESFQIVDDIIWFINPLAPAESNTEASLNFHPLNLQ
ncbi:MAG: hypothetical protein R2730_13820 [Chitinophagales bacterium]